MSDAGSRVTHPHLGPNQPRVHRQQADRATTGDGNADYYSEADMIKNHPSDAGHDYLARWMAAQTPKALEVPL